MKGLEDATQDLLRLGPSLRAIAAADFAGHDGGPERVFGTPIGGLNGVGVEEKGEHGRKLDGQMRGEMPGHAAPAGPIDEGIELIVQMPPGDGETVRRHRAGTVAIADRQRVVEHVLHARREVIVPVIAHQRATAPQQMGETGLVDRVIEAAIRRPAIADERARELRPQDGRRFLVAASRQNRVDGGVGRRKCPQPVQMAADFPAGFIGGDDGALAHVAAQGVIGGTGSVGGAVQGVHEPAGRDGQPKAVTQHGADFGERQPELRVQDGRERDRLRPELGGRRAQGVRRLPGMAPLHATATRAAATNLDGEGAHDRPNDREILLVLLRGANTAQAARTMRTRRGQRRVMAFVDLGGNRAMGFAPIRAARPSAGASRSPRRGAARERRRLAIHLAARVVELIFEVLDLFAERVAFVAVAIAVSIRPLMLASQPLDFALLPLELGNQLLTRRRVPLRLHASVMPCLSTKYKQKRVKPARRRPPMQPVTR